MRIIQIAHALTLHDGASKFVQKVDSMLQKMGYQTAIFAHKLDSRLADSNIGTMKQFDGTAEDIVIYHMTTGTSFNKWVAEYPHKIVLYYHNITPAKFFFGNAWGSWLKCIQGRRQLKGIVQNTFFAWGASEYSCQELRNMGLIGAKPLAAIVEPEKFLDQPRVDAIYNRYHDGRLNILFVGRGVPHKKQDEAIETLRYYKENISKEVRLILVGTMKPSYGKKLHRMAERYGLQNDIVFAGSVSNEELCTWYQTSDLLLCLSEHEGFCVPLVEAMIFDKPVFAYACAAVPETVGRAGVLLEDKQPDHVASIIHTTMTDPDKLSALSAARPQRLKELSYEQIFKQLQQDMKQIIQQWQEQKQ